MSDPNGWWGIAIGAASALIGFLNHRRNRAIVKLRLIVADGRFIISLTNNGHRPAPISIVSLHSKSGFRQVVQGVKFPAIINPDGTNLTSYHKIGDIQSKIFEDGKMWFEVKVANRKHRSNKVKIKAPLV